MADQFKNFECKCCMWYANKYCFMHLFKVLPHELCPEWEPLWEDI